MLDLSSLEKAVIAFKTSLEVYNQSPLQEQEAEKLLMRDGVIQRFEFTFELSWKMLKRYLELYTMEKPDGLINRDLFRIGCEQGLINDAEKWFGYLNMRNQTIHIYDEKKARAVFEAAKKFLPDAEFLLNKIKEKIK